MASDAPSMGASKRTSANSGLRNSQTVRPVSPHTPQQGSGNPSFTSSTSPGSSFRGEDDAIIFEIGARWLRAGFEGSSTPVCVVGFGPEESRRAGDYRGWIQGSAGAGRLPQPVDMEEWARAHELWRPDSREVDLGLVEDKIERAFRETYNQFLLTDAGTSRLVLVLPSLMPHPLLSSLLSTLFSRWRFPSATLLSSATMSAMAAGLRSALVVDLGWAEATATAIYEYREMTTKRTTRSMKHLMQEMGLLLTELASDGNQDTETADKISVGFAYCEEVVSRFAWCKSQAGENTSLDEPDRKLSIPSPANPEEEYMDVSFARLAEPAERILFAPGVAEHELDDEEKSLPLLVYNTLLSLYPDARGTCMSRIVFVGGGSRIPGLRQRVLTEVSLLIDRHGWSPIRGKALERQRQRLEALRLSAPKASNQSETSKSIGEAPSTDDETTDPSKEVPEIDFVEQKLRRQNKDIPVPIQGVLREVESLGPWAGASLTTSLKIRGMVEIDREKFLQHGLAGATRDIDHPVPDRRSGLRSGGDRSSWTLAGWA
ncbi:Actin-related protein RO7, putative [Penicillium digitatum]|uniref:Actin-related protein RO7, putative n=3 Tax=Penicillium digitatum TaxID=36651 RepID=K9G2Q5_PEND2|nr:Actin-related protein RO7, putative [Penicillium digitatum Pd1]EKV16255.1 Actin-related protein RO7, putative [Penicillium digitatum PHI26]EKV19428.1 Actin-related protein RO7, putative [Penicillium digitatum Pd1]QQK47323.1 Actin-related protein RO7, putative [Penicillium digitatum]